MLEVVYYTKFIQGLSVILFNQERLIGYYFWKKIQCTIY